MFIFQDDFFANANNTIFSLMAGASADIQFTSVLLNMRDKVNQTMFKLGLTLDQTIEGALPVFSDTLEDLDFSDSDNFAAYLCQKNPKRFRVRAEDIAISCRGWMFRFLFRFYRPQQVCTTLKTCYFWHSCQKMRVNRWWN